MTFKWNSSRLTPLEAVKIQLDHWLATRVKGSKNSKILLVSREIPCKIVYIQPNRNKAKDKFALTPGKNTGAFPASFFFKTQFY